MRDALSLLDQAIAHGAGKVEDEGVRAMLGTVGDEHLFALLDGLVTQNVQAMLEVAKLMDARSLSFDGGLQELATLFHRIALAQFAPEALLDETERSRLESYAQALDAEYLQLAYQIAIHGRDELSLAPDDHAGFVMTLLRLHAFRPERAGMANAVANAAPKVSAAPASARTPPPHPAPAAVRPAPTLVVPAAPAPPATTQVPVGDDWHALATRLPGMARQLAQHCELVERNETLVRLRLAPAHKHLQAHQEKLQLALRELWGAQLRLDITVAEPAGETPAARRQNSDRERQENAIASIEQDPFVRDVVDLFDASIDESTIKPV
jgi:DNA polymerase-3 subunit gamma/tau